LAHAGGIRTLLSKDHGGGLTFYRRSSELEKLKAAASMGYARGKLLEEAKTLPRDRKDWYD